MKEAERLAHVAAIEARDRHGCDDEHEVRFGRALATVNRFRSIVRQRVNRENVEHSDLGGEA